MTSSTSEFIHEEISMLFQSEKFHGWVVGDGGGIGIIATSSRYRSLRDLRLRLLVCAWR